MARTLSVGPHLDAATESPFSPSPCEERAGRGAAVSDLRQSRRLGGGGAAQSRRALRAKVRTVKSNQRAPVSLAPRGTSGERAGERGFLFLRAKLLLSPALSSFLRQEARESGIRHFGHSGSQSSTPGTVKLRESSGRAGGFPFGLKQALSWNNSVQNLLTTDGHGFTRIRNRDHRSLRPAMRFILWCGFG